MLCVMNGRAVLEFWCCCTSVLRRGVACRGVVQVSGLALVGIGVWLHIKGDSLFYTHLVRVSPRANAAASVAVPSSSSSSTAVHSSSSAVASSTASATSPSTVSTDVISVDSWPFFMMAAGSCVTLVGFLGCCGACTESVCFLSFVRSLLIS